MIRETPYFLVGPLLASLKTSGTLSAALLAPRAAVAVRPRASRSAADGTSTTQPTPWRMAMTLLRKNQMLDQYRPDCGGYHQTREMRD